MNVRDLPLVDLLLDEVSFDPRQSRGVVDVDGFDLYVIENGSGRGRIVGLDPVVGCGRSERKTRTRVKPKIRFGPMIWSTVSEREKRDRAEEGQAW